MMKNFKKSGFTLMELLVYMAIVGIVVVIAGEAFSNSTNFRVRTDNMIRSTQEAENVAMLFREDVSQMGAKNSVESGNADMGTFYGSFFGSVNPRVYMDPENPNTDIRDSSSFLLDVSNGFSDLTVRRYRYDDDGYYKAVEEIRWYVDVVGKDHVLKRACRTIPGTGEAAPLCPAVGTVEPRPEEAKDSAVTMATGVTQFKVDAAKPGAKEDETQLFPPDDMTTFRLVPRVGSLPFVSFSSLLDGSVVTLSNFVSNFKKGDDDASSGVVNLVNRRFNQAFAVKDEDGVGDWSVLCDEFGKMSLFPDTVYEISFDLGYSGVEDKSLMFIPGRDHMSVGFRKAGSGDYAKKNGKILLQDFLFFPPMDPENGMGTGKRSMRLTVPERIDNVCLAFTFAFYSPLAAQGKVKIKNLKVMKVATATYSFDGFDPDAAVNKKEKKNVKALKLKLQVSRGAKKGGKGESGDVDLTVAVPSNGPRD